MSSLFAAEQEYVRAWRVRAARIQKGIVDKIARRERISRNVEVAHLQQLTFGERVADGMADVAGSWSFIFSFFVLLAVWVLLNTVAFLHHWDKYPFILLNLMLSMLAAIQAPVIMMSQNRQEARDRLRSEHDYEVNLKAEMEIERILQKLDELPEGQWDELLTLQRQQIELLQRQLELLTDNTRSDG